MKAYLHEALIDIEYVTNFMAKTSTYQEDLAVRSAEGSEKSSSDSL